MKIEVVNELIDIIDYNLKENYTDLQYLKEILPIKNYSKIKKEIESIGLSMSDFQYTGVNAVPFRYIKGITILDMMELSKNYCEFMEVEQRVEAQRVLCEGYLLNDDFDGFIDFLDKRLKLDAYKVIYEFIPIEQRYSIFRKIYSRLEYGFNEDKEFLTYCFKDRFDSEDWKEAINNLKKKMKNKKLITIYRGECSKSTPYNDAFSWSTQKKIATFFANRFKNDGKIYKAQVLIDDVLDYIDLRDEDEVLVTADKLQNITRVK
jgi:hypothetical protein